MLIRSEQRFRSEYDGIVSLHCFSAGPHYDPERMGVGALIGFDEHVLEPGAGFAEHGHRGVDIVSRVVSGTLRHADASGELLVAAGQVLVQSCGDGARHEEVNASRDEPLRLIQMTLTAGAGDAGVRRGGPAVELPHGRLRVLGESVHHVQPPCFVHVVAGTATVDDLDLTAGDSVAPARRALLTVHGETVLWRLDAAAP